VEHPEGIRIGPSGLFYPQFMLTLFQNRELLIASRHQKEQVIIPVIEPVTGIVPIIPPDFDSDAFGTFSGEIERENGPLETLRKKCEAAMDQFGIDLAIASEGSFGPHPHYPFLQANEEWIMLKDKKNGLEIIAREISLETNYSEKKITSEKELRVFAAGTGFPEHGLILRSGDGNQEKIRKGIRSFEKLREAYHELRAGGIVQVQTDMRAMMNPSRMKVIEKAAIRLREKLLSLCPCCGIPGYEVERAEAGLPCSDCGRPGKEIQRIHYACKNCGHQEDRENPEGKQYGDPAYCDFCNP
jgi:hypothetical protein